MFLPGPSRASDLRATASATNAVATATIAAVANKIILVTHISCTFSAAPAAVTTAQLKSGTNVLMSWRINAQGGKEVAFSEPIAMNVGEAASIELGAGGAAVVGEVNIAGFLAS